MKLKFIPVSVRTITPTITVHKTGKLGFNISAIRSISIGNQTYFKIAKDENDCIFLLKTNSPDEAIKARKAGVYYYLDNSVFQELGFTTGQIFNLERVEHEGNTYYKLNKKGKP